MEDIRTAARRAQALTRQLLAFSRKQVLRPQPVNLGSLVQEVERLLIRLLGEDVDVVTRLAPGLRPVLADPGQLEQVLLNLAVNARDAMPRGGKLVIETRAVELDEAFVSRHVGAQVGPHAMLAISDTGCGMDAATLARVFEPFFTTKPQGKGTGLGLSTVYGIVKQSGGSIWAYSEVGRGTTFKVYLPFAGAPAPVTTEGPGAVEVRARPGEAVLVVEDDEAVRRSAVRCLEQLGYGVASASGLDEAVALARDGGRRYSALLSDVVMPGGSGMEVAQRVSVLLPGLPVIFMSGYTDDAISHHGLIAPGSIFLEKPFTLEVIGRTIREAIDRSGPPGAERSDDRRADRGAQGDGATLVPGTGGSRPGRP